MLEASSCPLSAEALERVFSQVRSRERSDRIATARMEPKKRLATTQWLQRS